MILILVAERNSKPQVIGIKLLVAYLENKLHP